MKLKQKELEIVYEGIIMFTSDNTRGWHDRLPKDQFDIAMDFARVSQKTAERSILQKKKIIHATRAERLEKNMEGKRRKEINLVVEKERLVNEIEKVGWLRCSKEAAGKYIFYH